MMRNVAIIAAVVLVPIVASYAIFAFIMWSANPHYWGLDARILCAMFWFIVQVTVVPMLMFFDLNR